MPIPSAEEVAAEARTLSEVTPGHLLRQAKRLLDQAEKLVEQAVIAERAKGSSWDTIGAVLGGVSKSAVQKRYGTRVERWKIRDDVQTALGSLGLPRQDIEAGVAHRHLKDEWKFAAEIVGTQGLLNELNNATSALSGDEWWVVGGSDLPSPEADRDECRFSSTHAADSDRLRRLRNYLAHTEAGHCPEALTGLLFTLAASAEATDHRTPLWAAEGAHRSQPLSEAFRQRLAALHSEPEGDGRGPHIPSQSQPSRTLEERVALLEEQLSVLMQGGDRRHRPPTRP
ncbi:hypothetical protein [Streptomyces sp. NPDC018321]|uniref:hypothetical protein n=1 Tax=unclassified Streptomyces TaxID=2593676 RepID=UPI00379CE65A